MKKHLFFLFLLISCSIFSQTTDVATGPLSAPSSLLLDGNELYVSHFNKITKIDLTNPVPTDVVTVSSQVSGMVLDNNFLYFSLNTLNKIVKLDINDVTATPEDVLTGLNNPSNLFLDGNLLYYSEFSGNRISRIDISGTNPTPEILISGLLNPTGINVIGNDLYYLEYSGHKLSKIDLTVTPVTPTIIISGLDNPSELFLDNNVLYVSAGTSNGKVIRGDISVTTPVFEDVVTSINTPLGILRDGSDLYIVENGANKVVKFDLNTLSTSVVHRDEMKLFPNPIDHTFSLKSEFTVEQIQVVDVYGKIVKTFNRSQDMYNIRELPRGVYFIRAKLPYGFAVDKVIKN